MQMKVMLDKWAYMPERAHEYDAGADLRTPFIVTVPAHGSATIDTGVHIQLPPYHVGMIKAKSGLNVKNGITCTGVIDTGYTGSIRVKLYNDSNENVQFDAGAKIAQLVVLPIALPKFVQVDSLEETERGDNGFGSTGV